MSLWNEPCIFSPSLICLDLCNLEAQVRELKIDVYEEKIRRTRTELEYLQNQIKPHFFVNCFSQKI